MHKLLTSSLLVTVFAFAGCQSKPRPVAPPPSEPLDAAALESLRSSLGGDSVVAGVARVLPTDNFLALNVPDTAAFAVGTPVTVIDSNKNTLAHGSVAAIVEGEVHIQFTVTGPRRPQIGDAVLAFPKR